MDLRENDGKMMGSKGKFAKWMEVSSWENGQWPFFHIAMFHYQRVNDD